MSPSYSIPAAAAALSVYGCIAFFDMGFPTCLAGRPDFSLFVYSEPAFLVYCGYISVMVLFMMAGVLSRNIPDRQGLSASPAAG